MFKDVDLTEYFDKIFELEELSHFNDDLCIPASKIIFDIVLYLAALKQKQKRTQELDLSIRVKNALDHSVLTPVTLDELAKQFYHSKNDIIRQFKQAYGITPYAYLISQRIQLAKNLLVTTKKLQRKFQNIFVFRLSTTSPTTLSNTSASALESTD